MKSSYLSFLRDWYTLIYSILVTDITWLMMMLLNTCVTVLWTKVNIFIFFTN